MLLRLQRLVKSGAKSSMPMSTIWFHVFVFWMCSARYDYHDAKLQKVMGITDWWRSFVPANVSASTPEEGTDSLWLVPGCWLLVADSCSGLCLIKTIRYVRGGVYRKCSTHSWLRHRIDESINRSIDVPQNMLQSDESMELHGIARVLTGLEDAPVKLEHKW